MEIIRFMENRRIKFYSTVRGYGLEGLVCEDEVVRIQPSTELYKKCGVTELSGIEKYPDIFEIALRKEILLSAEQAMAVGLDDQYQLVYRCDLKSFLVKLLAQTL
jgi:hypothetical protein